MQPAKESPLKMMQLFYNDTTPFVPSDKEQLVVRDITNLFRSTAEARNRNFQYFDGLNLIEYINDSVHRFNTNIDEREGIEDWQAAVHDQITRNKVLGVLGRVLEVLPITSFSPRGEETPVKADILTDLYHYTEEEDQYDELMIHILLEAIVKGTAIGYEDITYENKRIADVVGVGDKVTIKESRLKRTKIVGGIVPLEEFYPSSVSLRKTKDLPFCFWTKTMPFSKFIESFGQYKKSELVSAKRSFATSEQRPYYYDFMDANTPDGSVEVIRYYDKLNDQFIILANGIWLNPVNTDNGDEVMPMPWSHKELPFWEIKYDIFGDFFYGKSLPDRLKTMQDVLNVLTNMLLDQSFLTIFPPLLTAGIDDIEDDYLRPGRRTPVDTQGMPLTNAFHILQSPTPQGWHQFILQYTRTVIEESSMDKVSQGISGQGDRTTAYEIKTAAAGVAAMLQLFARFINQGLKRKAMLRVANILQYGMDQDAPMVQNITKDKYQNLKSFQSFTSKNAKIGKKRGTRIVEMYPDQASLPSRDEVQARAALAGLESGTEFEIHAITPEYLRNVLYDVELSTNPRSEKTKQSEQIMAGEKTKLYMTYFPDIVDRRELASQLMEKFGDDAAVLLTDEQQMAPEQAAMGGAPNDQRAEQMAGPDELQGLMTA